MAIGDIVESILGSLVGAKRPVTRQEKKVHRILTVIVIVFLICLVIFSWLYEALKQSCDVNSVTDTMSTECIVNSEKQSN